MITSTLIADGLIADSGVVTGSIFADCSINDLLSVQTDVFGTPFYKVIDYVKLNEKYYTTSKVHLNSIDTLNIKEIIKYMTNLFIRENISLVENTRVSVNKILEVIDILLPTETIDIKLKTGNIVAELLILNDLSKYAANLSTLDSIELTEKIGQTLRYFVFSSDSINLLENLSSSVFLVTEDTINTVEDIQTKLISSIQSNDSIKIIGTTNINGDDYQVWVMNSKTTGMTTYSDYPFNSIMGYKDTILGVSDNGLYNLNGSDPVEYLLTTGEIDFGTSRDKNCNRAYLYLNSSTELELKTIASRRGIKHINTYKVLPKSSQSDDMLRSIRLGGGIKGVWWQFELSGIDTEFELEKGEIHTELRNRSG